jgi:excisionase family DNA binding protein
VKIRKPTKRTKEQKGDHVGELVTIEELSRYLHVPESVLYRCVRMGQLPGSKVGGRWRLELLRVQDRLVDTYELKTNGEKKK